jgi:hypothetical protein
MPEILTNKSRGTEAGLSRIDQEEARTMSTPKRPTTPREQLAAKITEHLAELAQGKQNTIGHIDPKRGPSHLRERASIIDEINGSWAVFSMAIAVTNHEGTSDDTLAEALAYGLVKICTTGDAREKNERWEDGYKRAARMLLATVEHLNLNRAKIPR